MPNNCSELNTPKTNLLQITPEIEKLIDQALLEDISGKEVDTLLTGSRPVLHFTTNTSLQPKIVLNFVLSCFIVELL